MKRKINKTCEYGYNDCIHKGTIECKSCGHEAPTNYISKDDKE